LVLSIWRRRIKTFQTGILVTPSGGVLFGNRFRVVYLEYVKVLSKPLPAPPPLFFSIETLKTVVKCYSAGTPSEASLHRIITKFGRWKKMKGEEQVKLRLAVYCGYTRRMGYED
jgi:hypothetical protein